MAVDTQLMLTIAGVSATFVAIVSGFYTSKILSLSSDRQRIRNRISEIDAELKPQEKSAKNYEDLLHNYNKTIAEGSVDGLETDLLNDLTLRR
jgi:hypothetical protein